MSEATPCQWCNGSQRRVVVHAATHESHGMPCVCTAGTLPLQFLYQPETNGCGIAAIAMATATPYAEVRRRLVMSADLSGATGQGVDVGQIDDLLGALGFAWQARYAHCHRLRAPRNPWPCEPWADVHLCMVRNLSDSSGHFVVLLRDGRVLDPWWGVVGGLHRYPQVYSIKALYRVPASPTEPEQPATERT